MLPVTDDNTFDAVPLIHGRTWQEMPQGMTFRTDARTITESDLIAFITLCGFNEPLFWDARQSESAGYPGRLVPGALTYSLAEGLVIQTHILHGTGIAFMRADLDVRRPVVVGDTIEVVVEVTEVHPASRRGRGLVTTLNTVLNHRGEAVLVYSPLRLIRGDFGE